MPDLDKIVVLSRIFNVTTDYLLKDDAPPESGNPGENDAAEAGDSRGFYPGYGRCGLWEWGEAQSYLVMVRRYGLWVSFGVMLCILSPCPLVLLGGLSETFLPQMGENAAGVIGVIILLFMIAAAVLLFIVCEMRFKQFDYIKARGFLLDGETGVCVAEEKEAFEPQVYYFYRHRGSPLHFRHCANNVCGVASGRSCSGNGRMYGNGLFAGHGFCRRVFVYPHRVDL